MGATTKMITFQIMEGIDKGRIFRDIPLPVTIGREEGNQLRLNDERVSRFHAKIQLDSDDFILTDLESTNGTRVNGTIVQIRRLRYGDRVGVGRSLLLFGSNDEIAQRMAEMGGNKPSEGGEHKTKVFEGHGTIEGGTLAGLGDGNVDFDLNVQGATHSTKDAFFIGQKALPPVPQKMSPSQAARLAEVLDFLHQGLNLATENIQAKEDGSQVTLEFPDWQRIQAIQMILARYLRAVADPDTMAPE